MRAHNSRLSEVFQTECIKNRTSSRSPTSSTTIYTFVPSLCVATIHVIVLYTWLLRVKTLEIGESTELQGIALPESALRENGNYL